MDNIENYYVRIAVTGGDANVSSPAGRAENVSRILKIFFDNASWAPDVRSLSVWLRAGQQDNGEIAISCLDPGLGTGRPNSVLGDDAAGQARERVSSGGPRCQYDRDNPGHCHGPYPAE